MKIHPIYRKFPERTVSRILAQETDIDLEFPGFLDVYSSLSRIIPKHFIVIDFGCAMSPQCWYFRNHKKYIGIDMWPNRANCKELFAVANTEHHFVDAREWINQDYIYRHKTNVFAICSYVGEHLSDLVRATYQNCFCYYPTNEGDDKLRPKITQIKSLNRW